MTAATTASAAPVPVENDAPQISTRLAVASQWQLVWWAFKRHRLAMVGLFVTVILYVIAIVPGFFAVNDPSQQNTRRPAL